MNIVLIGPPGAGKGTQATRLFHEFNLIWISTGDLFHDHFKRKSALGLLAKRYIDRGDLVPDEVADAMVEEWLLQVPAETGLLFDGFPRTLYQAKFLAETFQQQKRGFDAAVYLKISDETAVQRLAGRMICSKCSAPFNVVSKPPGRTDVCDYCGSDLRQRSDDHPELVPIRLRNFHRSTAPLLEYYQAQDKLLIVDAEGPVDDVYLRLVEALRAVRERKLAPASQENVEALRRPPPARLLPEQVAHPALNLVLLGGPGCGKGTQAEHLCREFKIPGISTGELFRENLKLQTELGVLAKAFMDRGELVPDTVTEGMVERRLAQADTRNGFVLDGFPRTLAQAEALDDILSAMGRRVSGAISIEVSDAETIRRLSGRRICAGCKLSYHLTFKPPKQAGKCDQCGGDLIQRDDDNPETIRARLKNFHAQIQPLANYYHLQGLLAKVVGEGPPGEVTAHALAAVRSIASPESTVVT